MESDGSDLGSMTRTRARLSGALFIFLAILGVGSYFRARFYGTSASLPLANLLTKGALAQAMVTSKAYEGFPSEIDLPLD